jgi:hypothetical protein
MKKELMLAMFIVVLAGFVLAVSNNSNLGNNSDEDEQLVGTSCGTVTPGTNNECCINKGYTGWDQEEFECVGEQEQNQNQVGVTNSYKKANLTPEQIQNIVRIKNRIRAYYANSSECPNNCTCSGSTIKCFFGNGTRVMTIHAGNSGNVIVQVKNVNASTNVTLYKSDDGKVYGVFRNNETKVIILPDEVIEKLKERHQKRLQLENGSINLTEDGYYQVQTKKKARLFWLVPVREKFRAQVDAETGEIIKIRNPWWGFLARDNKE